MFLNRSSFYVASRGIAYFTLKELGEGEGDKIDSKDKNVVFLKIVP
jgi:hypothetical protein